MNQKNSTNSTKNANIKKVEFTMRISYAKVNKLASTIYHAWIEKHPEDRNRVTYNMAMREAWKEVKIASFRLENLEDFQKLDDENKLLVLRQKATLVPLLVMREKHLDENGKAVFHGVSRIAWMLRKKDDGKALESWNDSIDMIVSEMYIDVVTKWEKYLACNRKEKSFDDFLLCCAKNSAFRIGRSLEDKPSRQSKNNPSLDNPEFTHDISFNGKYYYPNPEEQAVAESFVESLCKDSIDIKIQHGKVYGYTQHEIGNECQLSQVAIHKRIKTMKAKMEMENASILVDEVNNTIFRTAEKSYAAKRMVKTSRQEVTADSRFYQYVDYRFIHSIPAPEDENM